MNLQLLREHLEDNKKLKNAGATNEDIQTAALTLIAEELGEIKAIAENTINELLNEGRLEELTGTDKPSLSKADGDD